MNVYVKKRIVVLGLLGVGVVSLVGCQRETGDRPRYNTPQKLDKILRCKIE